MLVLNGWVFGFIILRVLEEKCLLLFNDLWIFEEWDRMKNGW